LKPELWDAKVVPGEKKSVISDDDVNKYTEIQFIQYKLLVYLYLAQ